MRIRWKRLTSVTMSTCFYYANLNNGTACEQRILIPSRVCNVHYCTYNTVKMIGYSINLIKWALDFVIKSELFNIRNKPMWLRNDSLHYKFSLYLNSSISDTDMSDTIIVLKYSVGWSNNVFLFFKIFKIRVLHNLF